MTFAKDAATKGKGALLGSAVGLLAMASLSGCVSLGVKPPDELIRLTPEVTAPVGTVSSGQLTDAIVVLDPESDRSLDTLRVPVQVNETGIAYLQNALWTERPTRQMRTLLAETLRARSGKLVVEGGDFEVTGRTLIGGRLLAMGYDAPSRSVVVRFDAIRTVRGGGITTRRFEASVPDVKAKPAKVAAALNVAANKVAIEVADWVMGS